MSSQVLFLVNFSVLLLSIISFVEILVVFKNSSLLKYLILGISFCFVLNSFIAIIEPYTGYMKGVSEMPGAILAALSISLMSFLGYQKIKKAAIVISIFIIVTPIMILLKQHFIDHDDTSSHFQSPVRSGGSKYLVKTFFFATSVVLLNWIYFIQFVRKKNNDNIYFKQLRTWGYWYIILLSIIWFLNQFFISSIIPKQWVIISITTCHVCLILVFIFRPKFLNQSDFNITVDRLLVVNDLKFNHENFIHIFFDKEYYLDKSADLEVFCTQNNLFQADVENFVFQYYNMRFLDLVYKTRIEYFVNLVNTKNYTTLTIDALSQMSGFNSRQHLYKWFKKYHGGSPSDII